jgi:hypothetical protein
MRRVEHIVERDGKLDHAEPGAEVTAGHRCGIDRFCPQLIRKLSQLRRRELPQLRNRLYLIE